MSADSPRTWLDKLTHLFSGEQVDHLTQLTEILNASKEKNLIDADAVFMIEGVLGVSEMRVRDAMIPRSQMVCVDESEDLQAILDELLESSHSRYPVLADDGSVKGVLLTKDVLRAVVKHNLSEKAQLEELYRPPVLVPESKRLNVLLREFKASRNHMALVVDEYGELAGLITIEDVLEEIVGDIVDEHDEEESDHIQKHFQGGFSVDAVTFLEDFNAFFKTNIENEQLETIGGVVTQFLGHIPAEGETFEMEGLRFDVLKSDGRRVDSFKVQLPAITEASA